LVTINIIIAMIGTATTPLMTAASSSPVMVGPILEKVARGAALIYS
jgi:hypothetical protein